MPKYSWAAWCGLHSHLVREEQALEAQVQTTQMTPCTPTRHKIYSLWFRAMPPEAGNGVMSYMGYHGIAPLSLAKSLAVLSNAKTSGGFGKTHENILGAEDFKPFAHYQ